MKGVPPDGGSAQRETSFLLGLCYQKSGRDEKAWTSFKAVIAEEPSHWRARFHIALLQVQQGEFDEAEAMLQRVLQESPGHGTTTTLLKKLAERRAAVANHLRPPDVAET